MYYEHIIKELNKKVNNIDNLKKTKINIDIESTPIREKYKAKIKPLRKELRKITSNYISKNTNLIYGINEKAKKDNNWKPLFDLKLELGNLELKKSKAIIKLRDMRKSHGEDMSIFIKQKKNCSKEIIKLTEDIFERIRTK